MDRRRIDDSPALYGNSTSYDVTRQVSSSFRQSRRRTGASPALGAKAERHAEGFSVFERQGIGRHRATGAGVTLDGVAKCAGKLVRLKMREYG